MLEGFGQCGHSYPLRRSPAAVSAAFGVDALKQLAAQPPPRLDRSPWQGFGTATDASASIELGFGESGWQPALRSRSPVAGALRRHASLLRASEPGSVYR